MDTGRSTSEGQVDIKEKSFEEVPMKFWGWPRNWMGSREMWYQNGNELFNDILYLIISQEKQIKAVQLTQKYVQVGLVIVLYSAANAVKSIDSAKYTIYYILPLMGIFSIIRQIWNEEVSCNSIIFGLIAHQLIHFKCA